MAGTNVIFTKFSFVELIGYNQRMTLQENSWLSFLSIPQVTSKETSFSSPSIPVKMSCHVIVSGSEYACAETTLGLTSDTEAVLLIEFSSLERSHTATSVLAISKIGGSDFIWSGYSCLVSDSAFFSRVCLMSKKQIMGNSSCLV